MKVQGPKNIPLLSRLLTAVIVGVLALGALGALVSLGSPATAATTRTLSLAAKPTAALVNKAVTMSGVLTKSPKGSAVTIQRKVGASWVTAKEAKTTTSTGKYAVRVTLPSRAGTYSYRAVASMKGSLRPATSPVIKVSALTPVAATIKATPKPPATLTAGAKATLSGTVKPFVTNTTVTFQRFGTNKWVSTGVTAKLTSTGTFTQKIQVKDGSVFRVYVPRVGLKASAVSAGTAVIANPAISSASLPNGSKNSPYSTRVTQVGTNPGTWSVSPALPAGLSLNTSSGAITGTPTGTSSKDHTFSFAQPGLVTATKSLHLTITPPVPPTITTASLTSGQQGNAYSQTLVAQGNPAGTWTASPLPAGLSLVASTGVISGTPTTAGTTQVTIGFTQTSTGLAATPKTLDLTITPPPPVISTSFLPDASLLTSYSAQMTAVGNPPGTWSATITPSGSGFTMSAAGVLHNGFPFKSGVFQVTINFTATGNPTPAVPVQLTLTVK